MSKMPLAGEGHRNAGDDRVEKPACEREESPCCQGDAHGIIEECPEKILLYLLHRMPAYVHGYHNIPEISLHEYDVA